MSIKTYLTLATLSALSTFCFLENRRACRLEKTLLTLKAPQTPHPTSTQPSHTAQYHTLFDKVYTACLKQTFQNNNPFECIVQHVSKIAIGPNRLSRIIQYVTPENRTQLLTLREHEPSLENLQKLQTLAQRLSLSPDPSAY